MYTLIGIVDSVEIKFTFYPPNTFKATIPKKLDGIYIVELHCFDEAGNEAYFMDRLVQIDFRSMKMIQLPLNYRHLVGKYGYENEQPYELYGYKEINQCYEYSFLEDLYECDELGETYKFGELPLEYTAKEVKAWH